MNTNLSYNNEHLSNLLIGFLKNEIGRIGLKKAIIGLSGGIDSAVSAYLAALALGPKNVTCIIMPYKTSSPDSTEDALKVVSQLKVNHRIADITSSVDAALKQCVGDDISKVRKGNIMARMRMILLYDESARQNGLVIGTGNKTEILLGYSTIFGDSASAINPVGDLYKTQLRSLAEYLKVPSEILKKKPSADLWKGQTDEDELGFTYEQVDQYLYQKVDKKKSREALIKMGFKESFMDRVDKLIERSQFKRLPPLIAKVSKRTMNVDFRYNRDWKT
ncbi:MAG: NAD+ synthase [Ignavibacteria bacterium]|nr:NAD+ synthase [Ignavibacteria bacterium]